MDGRLTVANKIRLRLKSAPSASTNGNGTPYKTGEGFLHLCTDERVWAVRQVSTSNSVYVTAPTSLPISSSIDHVHDGVQDTAQKTGVTAIARVGNVLELLETKVGPKDVERTIVASLPVYENPDDGQNISMSGVERSVTLSRLFEDIPAADNTIHEALRNLLVFECPAASNGEKTHQASCYLPSDSLLLTAWKLLMQTANIGGIDLAVLVSYGPLLATIREDESDGLLYSAVLAAILRRYLPDNPSRRVEESEDSQLFGKLQAEDTCQFIGQLLIRVAGREGISIEMLTSDWTGLVPDSWSTHCSMSSLGPGYDVRLNAEGQEIAYYTQDNDSNLHASMRTDAIGKAQPATAAVITGKRKWHEKFAAQREAKK